MDRNPYRPILTEDARERLRPLELYLLTLGSASLGFMAFSGLFAGIGSAVPVVAFAGLGMSVAARILSKHHRALSALTAAAGTLALATAYFVYCWR